MKQLYNFTFTDTSWTFEFFDENAVRQTVTFYTREEAEAFNKVAFTLDLGGCCQ